MTYLFDTNIFIRSKNEMPMDIWPTFWTKLAEMIQAGHIYSSESVKDEIAIGRDELSEWVNNNAPDNFYMPLDLDILVKYHDTQVWAQSITTYSEAAKLTFAQVADAYLIATAAARGMTLVTYETPDSSCRRRVKIPDACNALGVRYCDLNTVLKELGITI